jgi:hypothetical protein
MSFFEKKKILPAQKVYEVRFCPVQKVCTWYKSTFRRFRDPRHDGFSKTRKVPFPDVPGTNKNEILPV